MPVTLTVHIRFSICQLVNTVGWGQEGYNNNNNNVNNNNIMCHIIVTAEVTIDYL